jgi:hypothetical protein
VQCTKRIAAMQHERFKPEGGAPIFAAYEKTKDEK